MINDSLVKALPTIMPGAIKWAEQMAVSIGREGLPLNEAGMKMARAVGVNHVELVRILEVDAIPLPDDPRLLQAIHQSDFFDENTVGMTLGHGIFIRRGRLSARLLAHELRHVHQYEMAGSIAGFLPEYLMDVAALGYKGSRFEVDAQAYEAVGQLAAS